jgi:hypothetical protein
MWKRQITGTDDGSNVRKYKQITRWQDKCQYNGWGFTIDITHIILYHEQLRSDQTGHISWKITLERLRRIREHNIKIGLRDRGCKD